MHYPVGQAAALEARGAVAEDPSEGAARLEEARDAWKALGRPIDAARCELLRGGRLLEAEDSSGGGAALNAAAEAGELLGVTHLARRARELIEA